MPAIAAIKAKLGSVVAALLPIRVPEVESGQGKLSEMGRIAAKLDMKHPLIVTDEIIVKLGLLESTLQSLSQAGLSFSVFDKVLPDPTCDMAEAGVQIYRANGCDGIIAVGGGSPMDCAKIIGAVIARPQPVEKFAGGFTVRAKLPPFIAVPTTAGTGSETTIAAVLSFPKLQKKLSVLDPSLTPHVAVLDPEILLKLPAPLTAATGMDALTHAIESFLSTWSTEFTEKYSLKAVADIFKYLYPSFKDGTDIAAREAMLQASFDAGVAFTRAGVGYVHAIAHQFGALFHTPHGVANAMLLPHVLQLYVDNKAAPEKMARLAVAAGLGSASDDAELLSARFVEAVFALRDSMNMTTHVRGLDEARVGEIATRALNECHGDSYKFSENPMGYIFDTGYPVPGYFTHEEVSEIVRKCFPSTESPEEALQRARL